MNILFGGLRRTPINDNAHTNQPKTGTNNGEVEGEEARPSGSGGGGGYIHRFGGERVDSVIKNKIKLLSFQTNIFLGLLISLSRILPPRPRTAPSKEAP
jgi:hypothetical protein